MHSVPTVVLTRAPEDNAGLAAELRARGVAVIELPAMTIEPVVDDRQLVGAVCALGPDDRLVFTSRAGVDAVRRAVAPADVHAPVAAVGPATAERCAEWGIDAWAPSEPSGAALGRELLFGSGVVLLARADRSDPAIVNELIARGAQVREVVAYHVVPRATGDVVAVQRAALAGATIVLASPAAVEGVASAIGTTALGCARVLALGATTARAVARAVGADPRIVRTLSADAIVRELEEVTHVAHR
jgi:uroporphyrinogen-III synthase